MRPGARREKGGGREHCDLPLPRPFPARNKANLGAGGRFTRADRPEYTVQHILPLFIPNLNLEYTEAPRGKGRCIVYPRQRMRWGRSTLHRFEQKFVPRRLGEDLGRPGPPINPYMVVHTRTDYI